MRNTDLLAKGEKKKIARSFNLASGTLLLSEASRLLPNPREFGTVFLS